LKTHLSINVNAVAQLRNRRDLPWPSVTGIARLVLENGADGITIHPRPDERHIRRTDVFDLQKLLRGEFPGAEYNIEGYPSPEFLDLVERAMPEQVTFVPDTPEQATSDHGWDVDANRDVLIPAIAHMKALGIRVSLFIDEFADVSAAAKDVGSGPYRTLHGALWRFLHAGRHGAASWASCEHCENSVDFRARR
jgi:pyridoxine 5-phosphate synthase